MSKAKEKLFEVVIKFLWEHIWPLIKEFLINIIKDLLEWLREIIIDFLKKFNKRKKEEAMKNAQEAEEKATTATNNEEIEKYKTIAQIWRKVAEDYRLENERIVGEFNILFKQAKQKTINKVEKINAEDIFETNEDKDIITLKKGFSLSLPLLPPQPEHKKIEDEDNHEEEDK